MEQAAAIPTIGAQPAAQRFMVARAAADQGQREPIGRLGGWALAAVGLSPVIDGQPG